MLTMGNVNPKLQESDADAFADRHKYQQCNAITCAPGQQKLDNQGTLGVTSTINLLRVRFPGWEQVPGIGSSNAWRSRPCCATQALSVTSRSRVSEGLPLLCTSCLFSHGKPASHRNRCGRVSQQL